MTKRKRRLFSAEFKLEAAQLVLDQNHSVTEAAQAMNVGKSTMDKWVRQLREKHQGKTPKASPKTPLKHPDSVEKVSMSKLLELSSNDLRIHTHKSWLTSQAN